MYMTPLDHDIAFLSLFINKFGKARCHTHDQARAQEGRQGTISATAAAVKLSYRVLLD